MDHLIKAINRFSPRDQPVLRADAGEAGMLELQLEQMRTRVYETQYTELKARRYLPVATDIDTGAETFSYEQTDEVGVAQIITNYANDLPSVTSRTEKIVHQIVALGDSFEYSIQDLRRAAFSGVPLDARKAKAARNAYERGLDALAARGNAAANIGGFVNAANVSISTPAAAGVWSGKTGPQILADLNKLVNEYIVANKETILPDTLLLPTAQYLTLTQTQMDTQNSRTVLEAFRASNPMVTMVDSWNVFDLAGAGPSDRIVLYKRDPEILELVIPQEFEVFAPEPRNLAFIVNCHGRTAGTCIYRPLGIRYMDAV
jgi:hypothetical protein